VPLVELIEKGRYLDALRLIASDKILQSVLRREGLLERLARDLAALAVMRGAKPEQVAQLLARIGVDGKYVEMLTRHPERLAPPEIRHLFEDVEKLVPPDRFVMDLRAAIKKEPRVARLLAAAYLIKYLSTARGRFSLSLVSKLTAIASLAGLDTLAKMLAELTTLPAKILEVLSRNRMVWSIEARLLADAEKLLERLRVLSEAITPENAEKIPQLLREAFQVAKRAAAVAKSAGYDLGIDPVLKALVYNAVASIVAAVAEGRINVEKARRLLAEIAPYASEVGLGNIVRMALEQPKLTVAEAYCILERYAPEVYSVLRESFAAAKRPLTRPGARLVPM